MTKEEIYPVNGYAPGNYFNICGTCKEQFLGDKRAVTCKVCALEAAHIYLTTEVSRLREALEAVRRHGLIEKDGYETVVKMVGEALTPSK
jgi:hypothetical protein